MTKLARLFSYFGVFLSSLVCVFVLFGVYFFFVRVFIKSAEEVLWPGSVSDGRAVVMLAICARASEKVVDWKGNSSGDG